jgi:hypothetical protein
MTPCPKPVKRVKERKPLKRGGPLKTTTRLERRTPMPVRAKAMDRHPPRRLDSPDADPARLEFVRHQPCVCASMDGAGPCWLAPGRNVNEASHASELGLGIKAIDLRTFSMCSAHHRAWTDHHGVFFGWSREQRVIFERVQIAATDVRWEIACASFGLGPVLPAPTTEDRGGEWRAKLVCVGVEAFGRSEVLALRRVKRAAGRALAFAISEAA